MCIHLYYVSCANSQIPSLMYLIFAKKQRITFFDPLGSQVGRKLFVADCIKICTLRVTQPLFPGLRDNCFLLGWLTRIYLSLLAHF